MTNEQKTKKSRNRKVYEMRLRGKTFREIGLKFEISSQRAHQIYLRQSEIFKLKGVKIS